VLVAWIQASICTSYCKGITETTLAELNFEKEASNVREVCSNLQ
jgi:hypothetical protein